MSSSWSILPTMRPTSMNEVNTEVFQVSALHPGIHMLLGLFNYQ